MVITATHKKDIIALETSESGIRVCRNVGARHMTNVQVTIRIGQGSRNQKNTLLLVAITFACTRMTVPIIIPNTFEC